MTDPQPQHLYKFREFSELHISSVASNKIWLAAPDTLNDRQDINLIDIVADVPNERLRREIQGISDEIRARSGIYSLSAAPLSHEMWTMYASKGRGFCIEYDTTNCDHSRSHLLPVIYSDEKRCYQTIEDLLVKNSPPKIPMLSRVSFSTSFAVSLFIGSLSKSFVFSRANRLLRKLTRAD